jgi:hypothetical protein
MEAQERNFISDYSQTNYFQRIHGDTVGPQSQMEPRKGTQVQGPAEKPDDF